MRSTHRVKMYLPSRFQKVPTCVDGNKLYIFTNPKSDKNKTYWHFRNIDVILPNPFGFDIHNYVDEVIKYDRRKICTNMIANKDIKFILDEYDCTDYFTYVYSDKYITNFVQVNTNDIIFYFYEKYQEVYKLCSVKIPKYMIQHCVSMAFAGSNNETLAFNFSDDDEEPIQIYLRKPAVPYNIDIGNVDDCNKLILEEYMVNYVTLSLGKI